MILITFILVLRNEFYRAFYGVFDDQFAVMDKLLNRKESFSCQVRTTSHTFNYITYDDDVTCFIIYKHATGF